MKFSKEIKAGLIALLAIVGFVLLFQFMKGRNVFSSDNIFFAKYKNVEGLKPSSPVSINGLKVGQVEKIIPITRNEKLHFLVQFTVKNNFEIFKSSLVEISELGLMSGKQLRVKLAYDSPLAKSGDTLQGSLKLSMMDDFSSQIGPLKNQLESVLKRVDSLTNNANKVLDNRNRAEISALLTGLNKTVAAYEGTSRNINSLLNNNDSRLQKVLDNTSVTMETANSAVSKYGNLAESIDTQSLNKTVANLDTTVGKLNNVIAGIENGDGTLGKVMKDEELYNHLDETMKNLNALIVDMKANPKRYVNFSVFGKNNKN